MSPRAPHLAGIMADADTMTETPVYFDTPEWDAVLEWLAFHGIDPRRIPAGSRVSRDECNRRIRFVAIVHDADGRPRLATPEDPFKFGPYAVEPMVEQGEAPPLPYPDLIARQLR